MFQGGCSIWQKLSKSLSFKKKHPDTIKHGEAITMGVVTDDIYPADLPLHHQVHIPERFNISGIDSNSLFVSFSQRSDLKRAPAGKRVLNVSAHTTTDYWFSLKKDYDSIKQSVQKQILEILKRKLPGFDRATIDFVFSATPVTWQNWVYRKKGRVGGIPQSMSRSLLDWPPAQTPF